MPPETPLSCEVESNQYRNMPVRGRGPCQASTLRSVRRSCLCMFVREKRKRVFPWASEKIWSSGVKKGARIKAPRVVTTQTAILEVWFILMFVLFCSFMSNPFPLAYHSRLYRQIPGLGRPCIRDFPRTTGCFLKECLSPRLWLVNVIVITTGGRGLSEPHPTS